MVVPARRDACKRGFSCPRLGLPVAVAAFSVACCARTWACASSLSRCALARLPATCLRRLRVVLPISFGVGVFFGSFSFIGDCLLYGFFPARSQPGSVWGKGQGVASARRQERASDG